MFSMRYLGVAVIVLAALFDVACDSREEIVKKAVDKEVQRVTSEAAAEQAKLYARENAKVIADAVKQETQDKVIPAAENAAGLPPYEIARRAFLESLKASGVTTQEARRKWIENQENAKQKFIERLKEKTGASAAHAEEVWYHGE